MDNRIHMQRLDLPRPVQDSRHHHSPANEQRAATAANRAAKYFSRAVSQSTNPPGENNRASVKNAGNRVWSSAKTTGNLLWKGTAEAGNMAWNGAKYSGAALGKFTVAPLQNRAWGALGGHALQQMVTCGLPTMLREEVFIEAYNVMLPHLVEKHPHAAVALQMSISLLSVAAHATLREPRLARDPQHNEVAVRGHFGLSEEQALILQRDKPQKWQAMKETHREASQRVSGQQIMAELMNTGMAIAGVASGNPGLSARVLSTQLRNMAYAFTREPGQAAISLTGSQNGRATFGVSDEHMHTNAAWYTVMTLAMGTLQDTLIASALPKGYTVSGPEIRDAQGQRLTGQELHTMGAVVSSLRAVCNSAIETIDAFLNKHYDTQQSGDSQQFSPSLPLKDFDRVMDHSIARLSWNNFANSSNLAVQQILQKASQDSIPHSTTDTLNNIGIAASLGLTYTMVNQIYQAHAKVRAAVASGAPPTDIENPAEISAEPTNFSRPLRHMASTTSTSALLRASASRDNLSTRSGPSSNPGSGVTTPFQQRDDYFSPLSQQHQPDSGAESAQPKEHPAGGTAEGKNHQNKPG